MESFIQDVNAIAGVINTLPNLAIWIIVALLTYKVAVIGSIFGVLKLAIDKFHDWAKSPTRHLEVIDVRAELNNITINDAWHPLLAQINRVKGARSRSGAYIHKADVEWLREAIDVKIAEELKERTGK
jgi:hypothetical protein